MSGSVERRRVLIVTNAFPPTMLADMQRARMLAYDLGNVGWEVEVLTPGLEYQKPIWIDPDAVALLPAAIPIHNVPEWRPSLFRRFGIGSIGWRAFWPMYRLGCLVLSRRRFDLVYFTTTQFSLFCLGPLWYGKFKVPYVLDFHDPWYRESRSYVTTPQTLKSQINISIAKSMEWFAVRRAAGIVSVSPQYLEQLEKRYHRFPGLQAGKRAVIPFGASSRDFEVAHANGSRSPEEADRSAIDICYVGAGGSIMAKSFRRILQSIKRIRAADSALVDKLRICLVGTYAYWKPGDPKELEAIANEEGLGDLVDEQPARIGYLQAMDRMIRSSGVLILGVDDPAYMPSKLFTYAMSGKPLLASLHRESQANVYFRDMLILGHLIHFDEKTAHDEVDDEPVRAFLVEAQKGQSIDRSEQISPYLSNASAKKHAELFEVCLN